MPVKPQPAFRLSDKLHRGNSAKCLLDRLNTHRGYFFTFGFYCRGNYVLHSLLAGIIEKKVSLYVYLLYPIEKKMVEES